MKRNFFGSFFKTLVLLSGMTIILLVATGLIYKPSSRSSASFIDDGPIERSVLLLIFDPYMDDIGGQKLTELKNWYDPDTHTQNLLEEFPKVSKNYLTYQVKERIEINEFFPLGDGFLYNSQTFLECLSDNSTCHQPYYINYKDIFDTYGVCDKDVDEVWMWGGPYFGYFEFHPVNYCGKTQFVMGFSYERGFGEALHNFGHRMEFVGIRRVGDGNWQQNEENEWNKFSKIEGHCGNVHYPPGNTVGQEEYVYNKVAFTNSDCEGYLKYPDGPYPNKRLNCSSWGCTQEGYVSWWLGHIPNNIGTTIKNGKTLYNNWWKYYVYFDETASSVEPTPTGSVQGEFTNLWSIMSVPGDSVFGFDYSGTTSRYTVDVSILPDMSWGTYLTFAEGATDPLVVVDPEKWDQVVCGKELYWTVKTSDGVISPIQKVTVACKEGNSDPLFTTSTLSQAREGRAYKTTIEAYDVDSTDTLRMVSLPNALNFKLDNCGSSTKAGKNYVKCSLTGTPLYTGTFQVHLNVYDSYGGTEKKTFSLNVR